MNTHALSHWGHERVSEEADRALIPSPFEKGEGNGRSGAVGSGAYGKEREICLVLSDFRPTIPS